MDKFVAVALKISHNGGIFTYRLPGASNTSSIGKRVRVTIKNRTALGVIIDEVAEPKNLVAIKDVIEIIDDQPIITKAQIDLMRFCANYYFNPLGLCVHIAVPRNEKSPKEKNVKVDSKKQTTVELSHDQAHAVDTILRNERGAFLLEGVTGSGKTHIYIKTAEHVLRQGKSILFIVPEISLTPQLIERVESALLVKTIVIHSNVTPSKKRDAIFALLKNQPQVVIGARSAIFAPIYNLGLIVVDEEHDSSFKQDESPQYHARDLALWRAKNESCRIILGSATPSLESVVNADKGKLVHLFLSERFSKDRVLPEVTIIDLKQRFSDVDLRGKDQSISDGQKMCILSRPLVENMTTTLNNGAQVLLFLNQRGYAKFGVCYSCGQMVECPNCSVGLTYYQNRNALACHLCLHTEIKASICRNCKHDNIKFLGLGTERLEEEVRALFPDHQTVRLDRDIIRSQRKLNETLSAMHEQRAHILIGTQMIAKGHDFRHVGLVGVVCADIALSLPDFRASEKTFQLLTQVAGRAGRGDFVGKALIQTFNPNHPSIIFAKDHNVKDFIRQELLLRKRFNQPPFMRAALIRSEHEDKTVSEETITRVKNILTKSERLQIFGPTPSPIERINQRFRFQCMVMAKEYATIHRAISCLLADKSFMSLVNKKRIRLILDVDPHNLC